MRLAVAPLRNLSPSINRHHKHLPSSKQQILSLRILVSHLHFRTILPPRRSSRILQSLSRRRKTIIQVVLRADHQEDSVPIPLQRLFRIHNSSIEPILHLKTPRLRDPGAFPPLQACHNAQLLALHMLMPFRCSKCTKVSCRDRQMLLSRARLVKMQHQMDLFSSNLRLSHHHHQVCLVPLPMRRP